MRYLAYVEYDGSNYFGYQTQKNKITIQEEITKALKILTKLDIEITSSGRTDAGVHAINQTFHFDINFVIKEEVFVKGLNKILPLDIQIKKIIKVVDNFHARHNVIKKEYHYKIMLTKPSVFESRYYSYYQIKDINIIKEALKLLVGEHDFYAFTPTPQENKPTIKTIYEASLEIIDNILIFKFVGSGFLKYMIRSIMGLLIDIGNYKKDISVITKMFETKSRKLASKTSSPNGLYLINVYY